MNRYRVFREHKLVTCMLADFQRLVGKADFRDNEAIIKIRKELDKIVALLKGHAEHENNRIHHFLREKNSTLQMHIEEDHKNHEQFFADLYQHLDKISSLTNADERENLGYQFYLAVRRFEGENLLHLHEEESAIMPALQLLYSDEELRQIDAMSYDHMSSQDMIHMLKALFPHYNPQDRRAFLTDIQILQPDKFIETWKGIEHEIDPREREELRQLLHIDAKN